MFPVFREHSAKCVPIKLLLFSALSLFYSNALTISSQPWLEHEKFTHNPFISLFFFFKSTQKFIGTYICEIQIHFCGILCNMPMLLVQPYPTVFVPTFGSLPAAAVAQSTFKGPVDKIWFHQIEFIRFPTKSRVCIHNIRISSGLVYQCLNEIRE